MSRAYARDRKVNQAHYKGTFRILVAIVLIMGVLFAIVKLSSRFFK